MVGAVLAALMASAESVGAAGGWQGQADRQVARLVTADLEGGEVRWLTSGAGPVLGAYSAPIEEPARGAVLLLHDLDAHLDWPQVIRPLRLYLSRHGWHVLALQMPAVPLGGAPARDDRRMELGRARVRAGLRDLERLDVAPLVIVGHGWGATLALDWTLAAPEGTIDGVVTINLAAPPGLMKRMKDLRVPMLDIYGERATTPVVRTAPHRARAQRSAGVQGSRQLLVPGADTEFTGLQDALVKWVRGWLERYPVDVPEPQAPDGASGSGVDTGAAGGSAG
jgi:pimeloyl-ACP methyl ester carboxylesterase